LTPDVLASKDTDTLSGSNFKASKTAFVVVCARAIAVGQCHDSIESHSRLSRASLAVLDVAVPPHRAKTAPRTSRPVPIDARRARAIAGRASITVLFPTRAFQYPLFPRNRARMSSCPFRQAK